MNTRLSITLALFWAATLTAPVAGQVMRSQVYQQFMKAEALTRRGNDSAAIAQLNQVVQLAPSFPPTYLREARLYDQLYQRNGKKESLNAAVFMYRKYLTLEFDEKLTQDASNRLRELENVLKVEHFEDEEQRDSEEELASTQAIQIVTDDASARAIASQPEKEMISDKKEETPMAANPSISGHQNSFISYYHTSIPTVATTQKAVPIALTPADLQGNWVTDAALEDGQNLWIFEIQPSGAENCAITVSGKSGILNKMENRKPSDNQTWSMAKHYLQEAKVLSKTLHEIINERVVVKPTTERLAFDVDVDEIFQESQALFKWGKNLVNNLSAALPFGNVINNYVNSYVEQQEKQNLSKSAIWTYSFFCRSIAPGVMRCEVSSLRKYTDQNNRSRTRAGDKQTMVLYRIDDLDANQSDDLDDKQYVEQWKSLFDQVRDKANYSATYKYPLAILYYYGVGIPRDEHKAIELMNSAAISANDIHAKVWLANYFYTQAFGNEEKSTGTRRKMLKSAQYWSQQLYPLKEWYGVKGDMLLLEQQRTLGTALKDSALFFYRKGDELGDSYSTLRLGTLLALENAHRSEAEPLLLKAANDGKADAYLELAHIKLAQKDMDGYLQQLSKAADQGCPEAYEELASDYMSGDGRGIELNPQKSLQMSHLAKRAHRDEWIGLLQDAGITVELQNH